MITRPLDLASRLRTPPRNFDAWFLVNAGLIALAFTLFGSRFVLAPGLGIDFQLPQMAGARSQALVTTHTISVTDTGLIIATDGTITLKRLGEWLKAEAAITKDPVLLVRADADVKSAQQITILELAHQAGFRVLWAVLEPSKQNGKR